MEGRPRMSSLLDYRLTVVLRNLKHSNPAKERKYVAYSFRSQGMHYIFHRCSWRLKETSMPMCQDSPLFCLMRKSVCVCPQRLLDSNSVSFTTKSAFTTSTSELETVVSPLALTFEVRLRLRQARSRSKEKSFYRYYYFGGRESYRASKS